LTPRSIGPARSLMLLPQPNGSSVSLHFCWLMTYGVPTSAQRSARAGVRESALPR
jgi:hypothetical protein